MSLRSLEASFLRYGSVAIVRTLALGIAIIALAAGAAESTGDVLRGIAAAYYQDAGSVANVTGRETAMDYYQRLLDDADLTDQTAPTGYPPVTWNDFVRAFSQLDMSLATQLLRQSFRPMAAIRGLSESFVRSSRDQTLQPVALYVPTGYLPGKPMPLVVFLHGHLQTESRLIAARYITDLAQQSSTIVIAPYGRGAYDFQGSESDVYDALDAASRAFTIDPRRRYLAGYSMGGFSAFRLAPIHPNDWSAVMCIAGSLLASRAPQVASSMQKARFYVITGARDDNVPTSFSTATAVYLRDAGLAVTFYSQPDGTHSLYSLRSVLSRAWTEMESGVVRTPAGLTGAANLPEAVQ
jgi:predicted esterase